MRSTKSGPPAPPALLPPVLPIDACLPELVAALESAGSLVLEAAPGAGKTTRVPPAFLESKAVQGRGILVLEPRRLAAKMAAIRVAEELGERVGETVGYQFRFESVGGPRTRIQFLTEGMFTRRLLSDPVLARVGLVIVDEFHERHLQGDFALAYLRRLQATRRPELKIIVMSATLDVQRIAGYLGAGTRVVRVPGRLFEVAVEYRPDVDVPGAALRELAREGDGDILAFLPGIADIRRAHSALTGAAAAKGVLVLPLYGDLSREEQDRAVRPVPGRRKVILSTNVAETSLTIDGVRAVIDSGLARVASYSWWSGIPALRTRPISRASATQRAGRAGRQGPGRCVRLFSKDSFDSRAPYETPEVLRADLSQLLLEAHALGIGDLAELGLLEAPPAAAVESARRLLHRLGARSHGGQAGGELTSLGRRMVELPAHPRLARLALEGERLGVARQACLLAALLAEGDGRELEVVDRLARWRPEGHAARAADQLLRALERHRPASGPPVGSPAPDRAQRLRRALLAAFPDRVARLRWLGSQVSRARGARAAELVLGGGGSAKIENADELHGEAEYYVAVDVEERSRQGERQAALARGLCAIQPEWLFDVEPPGVAEATEVRWDAARERAEATARITYDGLVLSESALGGGAGGSEPVARVLEQAALAAGIGRFCDEAAATALLERARLVREGLPDPAFPVWTRESLLGELGALCRTRASFRELEEADLLAALAGRLSPEQRRKLDQMAPSFVVLAKGRRVPVRYEAGKPPWIESRLQDFFGMSRGPAILGGKKSLVLHLLAPNQRAVQVTADLAGFWDRVYPKLRIELGRRYPKHAWPVDPTK